MVSHGFQGDLLSGSWRSSAELRGAPWRSSAAEIRRGAPRSSAAELRAGAPRSSAGCGTAMRGLISMSLSREEYCTIGEPHSVGLDRKVAFNIDDNVHVATS